MDNKIGIRRFLNDQGYSDNDITYDNGSVKLKNRTFAYATPEDDGSTYGNQADLRNALNTYKTAGLMDTITQKVNTPPPAFTYNRATDPLYQDALKSASMNAQTAGNNAMVSLGSRGIGNSSITSDRVAQIQQNELGKVERDIAPQLYNQAYQKYLTDYNMQQDQLKNLYGLVDTQNKFNQQDITNERNAKQDALALQDIHINRAKDLETRYGVKVNPTDDYSQSLAQVEGLKPVSQQNAERAADKARKDEAWAKVEQLGYVPSDAADILGIPAGTPTMKAKEFAHRVSNDNAQIGISQQNANTAAKNAETSANKPSGSTPKAQTVDDVVKQVDSIKVDELDDNSDKTGRKIVKDIAHAESIILDSDLSDADKIKAYKRIFSPAQLKQLGFEG